MRKRTVIAKMAFSVSGMVFLMVLMLCWSTKVNAQYITGMVHNSNGSGIAGANVLLLSSADSSLEKGVITDATGRFLINGFRPGSTLSVYLMRNIVSFNLKLLR